MGDVIGDLNSRRGRIEGMELRGTTQIIKAMVPLSEMFGYATDIRSRTQGARQFYDALRKVRRSSRQFGGRDREQGAREGDKVNGKGKI